MPRPCPHDARRAATRTRSTIRFMPPLCVTQAEVDEAYAILCASLDQVLADASTLPA